MKASQVLQEAVLILPLAKNGHSIFLQKIPFLKNTMAALNIFKAAIVFFKNGIFCRKIEWPFFAKGNIKTASCKTCDAFIRVIHRQCNTITFKIINFKGLYFATTFRCESHSQFSFSFKNSICSTVLITKCMTANNNWCCPISYQSWNIFYDNWFTENSSI